MQLEQHAMSYKVKKKKVNFHFKLGTFIGKKETDLLAAKLSALRECNTSTKYAATGPKDISDLK